MTVRWARAVLAALLTPMLARAQDEPIRVALRVTSSTAGPIVVDRGSVDHLLAGDRVLLYPRGGGSRGATVRQVSARSAVVECDDTTYQPEPGTRGEVTIPRARVAPEPAKQPEAAQQPEHQDWPDRGDGWQEGMPLLAKVKPVRPEQRGESLRGRVWMLGDLVRAATDDHGDAFANSLLRTGTALTFDNFLGRGETIAADVELAVRSGFDDDMSSVLEIRRLSYAEGGTRFRPNRFEVGRFMQSAMPEFGILDGFEWSRRTEDGHRFGASIGFLPNPDDDLSTGDDFQVAGSVHLVADAQERASFDFGYQKTFHHGTSDRDLFVLKGRYAPEEGWDLFGTAWIDGYGGARDAAKGNGFDVTQALFTVRRFETDGSGWDLTYWRHAFPLTQRNEFTPVTITEVDDDHTDRLALSGTTGAYGTAHWRGEIAGFADQSGSGGSCEIARSVPDFLFDGFTLEMAAFGSIAQFENTVGLRLLLSHVVQDGRFDLSYEIANHHLAGRDANADDLLQHRLRVSRSLFLDAGWSLSFHGDVVLWDDDLSYALGFFVQRSF
ncbi:MAG: hypothetical protein U1F36_12980 [Planctomycetota bacterium]